MGTTRTHRAAIRLRPNHCRVALLFLTVFSVGAGSAQAKKSRKLLHIRSISISVKNVFDPNVAGENIWPYRWANAIHIRTRPSIILNQLLVKPGDVVDPELLAESERNLRALSFIKDATIAQVPAPNGQVDLIVQTEDTWTTQPQLNFGSQGGQSQSSAGLLEENVLGYGKTLSYFYRSDANGPGNEFTYQDPQMGKTRLQLTTQFVTKSTGDEEHFSLQQPFYSLETQKSGGFAFDRTKSLQKVFQGGNEINQYGAQSVHVEPFVGMLLNHDILNVQRLSLNYHYQKVSYTGTTMTEQPGDVPDNIAQSGPQLTWTLSQTEFIKEHFIDNAGRVEDINLGHQLTVSTGYSDRLVGATQNCVPFAASDGYGFGTTGTWFGLASYGLQGRYNTYAHDQTGGRLLNALYFGNFNLYRHWATSFPSTGIMHLEAAHLQNGDQLNLLQLGGDTGLRGFKVGSFTGNKSMLLNLENRFWYPHELLHLVYAGGAVFADGGEVQPQGLPFTFTDVHADIGAGFRFALSRASAGGTVVRIDLAYALGPIQQGHRIILSVTSGQGFNRSSNSYRNAGAPSF